MEGEGCFNIGFKLRKDLNTCIQVSPEVSVTQHINGRKSLEIVKTIFGGVGSDIKLKSGSKTVLVYNVTKLSDLRTIAIPFLLKYNAESSRMAEINTLSFVCDHIESGKHLTPEGMHDIINRFFDTP